MTLKTIQLPITLTKHQSKMKDYYFDQKQDWTLEEMFIACEVSKKAVNITHGMKGLLTTQELRQQFMARVPIYPTQTQVFDLLHQFRCEQLELNPMSDDDFKEIFSLNPVNALIQYFKEQVSPECVERIHKCGITVEQLIEQKKQKRDIHVIKAIRNACFN